MPYSILLFANRVKNIRVYMYIYKQHSSFNLEA
jgi:hypothetical protein